MDPSFFRTADKKRPRSGLRLSGRGGRLVGFGVVAVGILAVGTWAVVRFGTSKTSAPAAAPDLIEAAVRLSAASPAGGAVPERAAAAPAAPAAPAARRAAPANPPTPGGDARSTASAEPVTLLVAAGLSAPPAAVAAVAPVASPSIAPTPTVLAAGPVAAPPVRPAETPPAAAPAPPTAAVSDGPSANDAELAREGHISPHAPRPDQVTTARKKELIDRLAEGEALLAKKDLLAARAKLNAVVDKGLPPDANARAIAALEQVAKETILSQDHVPDDPATDTFQVPPGGVFERIGRSHKVQGRLLMSINNIDEKRLQAGQTIKVVNGPFHAVVDKSDFTLTVYLDVRQGEGKSPEPVFIRRFRVGLGQYNSTPVGVWSVDAMELNPKYRHPRSGRIMAPDDPEYPLGKPGRWVRLKGLAGGAVGQTGYGIHGTNQPESIGKLESLGCVRLLDKDMAVLWDLLTVGDSRVTIRD